MVLLYADENFPLPVVKNLTNMGYNVLTAQAAGKENLQIPDEEVLAFAVNNGRAVLTRNRRDFIRLHIANSNHEGIIVCTEDSNFVGVANRIHGTISTTESLKNKLIRINRSS